MTDDPRFPNGFDGAYGAGVPLSAVKANQGIAMNHYLTGQYASKSAQPGAIRSAGLGVIFTYEESAGELVNASRATGQNVGRKILAAIAALPPDERPPLDGSVAVYVSVDVAVYGNYGACDLGFLGVKDVLRGKLQTRAYAEGAVIDHLALAGITEGKGWLSASTGYPGWNGADPNVCLVQRVGSPVPSTDLNDITDVHALGAWWPDNSPFNGGTMPLTADDVALIWGAQEHDVDAAGNPQSGNHPAWQWLTSINDVKGAVTALAAQVSALQDAVSKIQTGTPASPAGFTFTGTATPSP